MLKDLLHQELSSMGIELKDDSLGTLERFEKMMLETNKSLNLTSITDVAEVTIKHFADSLSLMRYSQLIHAETILDVGTGAGFPGLPLAIALPDKSFVLLDSLKKRIDFINAFCHSAAINNVVAIHARAEDFVKEAGRREGFDCVVSRAVAELNVLSEYCLPFVKIGGYFLAMKGPDVRQEVDDAKNAVSILGGQITELSEFMLAGEHQRSVVIIAKRSKTPNQYPRRAGMPKKRPLL